MSVHIHIHQHADETSLAIQQRIAVAVERLAEQGDTDLAKRLDAMSKEVKGAADALQDAIPSPAISPSNT